MNEESEEAMSLFIENTSTKESCWIDFALVDMFRTYFLILISSVSICSCSFMTLSSVFDFKIVL